MTWLFAACALFWTGIFLYTLRLGTHQTDLDRRIDEIRERMRERD